MYDIPPPIEYHDLNVMAQKATKEDYPWWWNEHGCNGTRWFGPLPCRDVTND